MNPTSPQPTLWYSWAYGKDNYHVEALALMLSALAQKTPNSRFRIYSDKPQWYAWLSPLVEVQEITGAQVQTWKAGSKNPFRARAKLIEHTSATFSGHTVWLDTDMWAMHSLGVLERILDKGHPLMHFADDKRLDGQTTPLRSFPNTDACNAGIVGLPAGWAGRATQVVNLVDEMEKQGDYGWCTEQAAHAKVLFDTGLLTPAEHVFYHYWGRKGFFWQPLIKQLVLQIALNQRTPELILDWIHQLPKETFHNRPATWLEHKKCSLSKRLGLTTYS